tara:strand:- start:832 stop:1698 length:867 start_codon:yes stop_codon:yes gene_type:complete
MLSNRNFFKKDYKSIQKFINKFNINDFNNQKKVQNYFKFFDLDLLIRKKLSSDKIRAHHDLIFKNVIKEEKKPFEYELDDLCRLHWIILSKKVLNTLEFGSGFSTLFMADACYILSRYFSNLNNIRVEKNFHVYALEESRKFLTITKKRIPKELKKYVTLVYSPVKGIKFENKFATVYEKKPSISPDFVYLDGPTQYAVKKKIDGFDFSGISRFPMSADLLQMEYFLEPGAFILVDGRTANARFLNDYFKRKWSYNEDHNGDCHYFELKEKPLGIHNKNKLKFKLEQI